METVFDREAALDRCDGDLELLREVAAMFRESAPAMMAELRQACAARDAGGLNRAAHKLNGSAGSLGAVLVLAVGQRLEAIGADGDLLEGETLLATLEAEMARLVVALDELLL